MKNKKKAKTTLASNTKISKTSAPPLHASRPLIDIDDVFVKYGSETILEDVSLCVHRGEFIGLIGPNGAGKTTLLRVILGLTPPTSGRAKSSAKISYVPQRGELYGGSVPISVREVVLLGAKNAQKADEALRFVGLQSLVNKRFTELSGGQQQRVIIAKALATHTDILVLDEPTTGIDERAQQDFYSLLQALQQQGITVLMVSHEVDTVLNLVNRVVCLNRKVLYDGPPEHFTVDDYLPRTYKQQHVRLHHEGGSE